MNLLRYVFPGPPRAVYLDRGDIAPAADRRFLCLFVAVPGSADARSLQMLAQLVTPRPAPPAGG